MSNTINLVVRVRDESRAGFAAVNQSLRDLRARTMAAGQSGGALQNTFARLGTQLTALRGHFTQTGQVGSRFHGVLNAMRGGLTSVRDAFNGSRLAGVSFQGILGNVRSGLNRVTSAMSDNKGMTALVAGAWLLLGPAAGILAAALTVALAGAFIGLGAAALKGDAQVKAAFGSLKSTVTSTVKDAAQPLKPFLIDGMHELTSAAQQAGPALRQAFTAVGPMVHPLIAGITELGKQAMPGLLAALSRARPAMDGFSTALGDIGHGVGEMFSRLTKDPQALKNIWLEVGNGLGSFVTNLGDLMGTAASSGTSLVLLKGVFAVLNTAVGAVTLSIKGLDAVTFGIFDGLKGGSDTSTKSIAELNKALEDNSKKTKAAQIEANVWGGGATAKNGKAKLKDLAAERVKLESQLAQATAKTTVANQDETKSVQQLMDAMTKLNDKVRGSLDAQAGMEQAIDDAAAAAKKGASSLKMHNGELDLNSQKARDSYNALSQLAAKTEANAQAARKSGQLWEEVNGIYGRGRSKLIELAHAMGLSTADAKRLADQILRTPSKTTRLKMISEDLESKLAAAKKHLASLPKSKSTKVRADTAAARIGVASLQKAIDYLHGKTVNINYKVNGTVRGGDVGGHYASGGVTGGGQALALVGEEGPELVRLPTGSKVYPAGQSARMMEDGEPVQAFAKGGTVSKAEKAARSGAQGDLTVSYFGKKAGYKNSEFAGALGSPAALGDLVDSLNKWRGIIKAATSGAQERGLLKSLDRTAAGLIAHEKALTKVNAALATAKDKLASLKDASAQLASSVKSSIVAFGSIAKGGQPSWQTGPSGIMQQLRNDVDSAKAFAGALAQLKKKGLNSQSLSEIAQAGVEGGGLETAQRLMGASGSDIKQINSLEAQLKKAAGAAGKTTADSMYAAGIKAADGLVKGLQKRQKSLDAVMERAAKALEKAIERAFKRKATGGIIGAASGGVRGGLTWVGEQGPELARLPYGSTVYPAGQSRQMAMAGGGGGQVIQVNLVLDGKVAARALIDPLKGEVHRISGGSVQKALGQGNG